MSTAPESLSLDEPHSQDEGIEYVLSEDVLSYVREVAARRDPALARHYQTMPSSRVKDGLSVALQILEVHLELKRRYGRGARTGARAHHAAIRRLLEATNTSSLVLAQAFLEAGFAVLPSSPASPPE